MNFPHSQEKQIRWSSFILALFFLVCAVLILASTGFLLIYVIADTSRQTTEGLLSILMLAGGSVVLGVLLIPGIYLNFRRFFNQPDTKIPFPKFQNRILLTTLMTIWLITLVLGLAFTKSILFNVILLPFLNVIAVGLPILFYLRISLRDLELPSAYRGWSLFGATLIISPALAFLFEALVLGVIAVFVIIYSTNSPGLQEMLKSIFYNLQNGRQSDNETMRLAANLIFTPGFAITTLGTFSIIVPIIEESCKVILIFPLINRIHRPMDGYILGTLCGAAFALVENIGFTSAGSTDWALNVLARSTAALPHMFNSGLFGWALVSGWKEHKYAQLLITFLAIILVHGSWNAVSLGLAVNSFSAFLPSIPFLFQNSYPWAVGWIVLAAGAFGGLIFNNLQMRKQMKKDIEKNLRYNSPLILNRPGENENGNAENIH